MQRKTLFTSGVATVFVLFLGLLLTIGMNLYPTTQSPSKPLDHISSSWGALLLAVVVVVGAAKISGWFLALIRQPPVMGEVIAGIVLGPSVFGRLVPQGSHGIGYDTIFSPATLVGIQSLGQIGIVLFMFLVGVEFDAKHFKEKIAETTAISMTSMMVPFVLGVSLALMIYESYAPKEVGFLKFSLFLGTSMAITAFPVLVRLIKDLGLEGRGFANLAVSCAAVNDGVAWCLLAAVSSLAVGSWSQFTVQSLGFVLFLLAQVYLVRPLLKTLAKRCESRQRDSSAMKSGTLTIVLCLVFVSALITDKLGVHALLGAFVVGTFVARESRMAEDLSAKIGPLLSVLLGPLFFAYAGLKLNFDFLQSFEGLKLLAIVVLLATVGKVGGAYLGGLLYTKNRSEAWALGFLMNTRGLMEIIVLTMGREMGIISDDLFAVFLGMALITTFMTAPMLHLILRPGQK